MGSRNTPAATWSVEGNLSDRAVARELCRKLPITLLDVGFRLHDPSVVRGSPTLALPYLAYQDQDQPSHLNGPEGGHSLVTPPTLPPLKSVRQMCSQIALTDSD